MAKSPAQDLFGLDPNSSELHHCFPRAAVSKRVTNVLIGITYWNYIYFYEKDVIHSA
jgi:hypothetical protein